MIWTRDPVGVRAGFESNIFVFYIRHLYFELKSLDAPPPLSTRAGLGGRKLPGS